MFLRAEGAPLPLGAVSTRNSACARLCSWALFSHHGKLRLCARPCSWALFLLQETQLCARPSLQNIKQEI